VARIGPVPHSRSKIQASEHDIDLKVRRVTCKLVVSTSGFHCVYTAWLLFKPLVVNYLRHILPHPCGVTVSRFVRCLTLC
jgi:hypothetical protein